MTSVSAIVFFLILLLLLVSSFLVVIERNRCRRIENLLRQQSNRERLVTRIALQIRQSLDLEQVAHQHIFPPVAPHNLLQGLRPFAP